MDWGMVFDLIDPALIIVVAACWVIGMILKNTPRIPDWTIVYIVTITAVVIVVLLHGLTVEAVLQGILCGAFAVYGHQIAKQTRERE